MPHRPKRLYKYRAFSVNTLRLLDQAEIYYASPTSFNDPLDCNPTLETDVGVKEIERLLFKMLESDVGREKALSVIGNIRYMSGENGDYRVGGEAAAAYLNWMSSDIRKLLIKELSGRGVLALASKWDCPLMWSHYADEHRGICVEYEVEDSNFYDLRPVSYTSPRAIKASDLIDWKMRRSLEAKEKIVHAFFFSKASQWRYEKEWRDLSPAAEVRSAPARISSVYFGLRCDESVVSTVVRLFANASYPLNFYSVHPKGATFKLTRYPVDTSEIEAFGVRVPDFLRIRDAVLGFSDVDSNAV